MADGLVFLASVALAIAIAVAVVVFCWSAFLLGLHLMGWLSTRGDD